MADGKEQPKLTLKQQLFVDAYLGAANGNATEAARMAGYKSPHPEGSRLLRNATILARVNQKLEASGITADAVLAELADVGFADWREFVEVLGRDKEGKPTRTKMDLTNKVKSLELLGKHLQLFIDRQIVDVNMREHRVGVPQSTLEAMFQPAEQSERLDA